MYNDYSDAPFMLKKLEIPRAREQLCTIRMHWHDDLLLVSL